MNIKKVSLTFLAVIPLSTFLLLPSPAHATSVNYNYLLNDGVLDAHNIMSAGQIDSFLNSFPNSCISTASGFKSQDPTGYNPTNGFIYGGNVSAGKVIYDAAQAYQINPQVLLTTMQKEQSLVTGMDGGTNICTSPTTNNSSKLRIVGAMGYGCPDGGTTHNYSGTSLYNINGTEVTTVTGTCVSSTQEVGFSQQVIHASWLLKFDRERAEGNVSWAITSGNWDNSDDPSTCYYGYMTKGNYQTCPSGSAVPYDGKYTIDNKSVQMDNGATAALYDYTPHLSGNANFVTIFDSWFGNSAGTYAWYTNGYAMYDKNGTTKIDPGDLQPGGEYLVKMTAINVGTATWYNNGYIPVHLGTDRSPGHNSLLCDSSWLSCGRPASLQESSVPPGQTGTFSFLIRAPYKPGTYREYFKPVAEEYTWFGSLENPIHESLGIVVKSPGTYAWWTNGYTVYDKSGSTKIDPGDLQPGAQYLIKTTAINVGSATWYNSGPEPINFATDNSEGHNSFLCVNGSWLNCARPTSLQQSNVAPRQTGTFQFIVQAPYRPGNYREFFKPVAENYSWFGSMAGAQESLGVVVKNPGSYAWWTSGYAVYSNNGTTQVDANALQTNTEYMVRMTAINVGSATWYNSGPTPVNLGTDNPEGNYGKLCVPGSWISCARPTTLQQPSVAPQQSGTFQFLIKTPGTAGNYSESFKPLAEEYTWFGSLTSNLETLNIVVQ